MSKIDDLIEKYCADGVEYKKLGECSKIVRGNRVTKKDLLENGKYPVISGGVMLMYGKEASNRKQEIDRQHYTIPNQRPKDKHCGKI